MRDCLLISIWDWVVGNLDSGGRLFVATRTSNLFGVFVGEGNVVFGGERRNGNMPTVPNDISRHPTPHKTNLETNYVYRYFTVYMFFLISRSSVLF